MRPPMLTAFNRETAATNAMGKKIKRKDGAAEPIKVLGVTDEGMFLGDLEGGPFVSFEWALANAIFVDGKPCGVEI